MSLLRPLISAQQSTITTLLLQKILNNASISIGLRPKELSPSGPIHFRLSTRSSTLMVFGQLRTRPTPISKVKSMSNLSLSQRDISSQPSGTASMIPLGSLPLTLPRKALMNFRSFLSTRQKDHMMLTASLLMPPILISPFTILALDKLKRETSLSITCILFMVML